MAVIQYTALVNQLRGKVNGSVLNKSRTVNTLQRKQQPPKGSRGFQSEIRQLFSAAQRNWKNLTTVNQQSWQTCASNNPARDRFGNQVILSGYNQYVKASVNNDYVNLITPDQAFTGAAPGATATDIVLENISFYADVDRGVVFQGILDMGLSDRTTSFGWVLDISVPISSGVTSYHGRWVNVAGNPANFNIPRNINASLGSYYPLPYIGQRLLYRLRLVHRMTGQVVSEYVDSIAAWGLMPRITNFSVEPSSGTAPYVISASFFAKDMIDGVDIVLNSFTNNPTGYCPLINDVPFQNNTIAESLLDTGVYIFTTTVPQGVCYAVKIQLKNNTTDTVLQESIIHISNL